MASAEDIKFVDENGMNVTGEYDLASEPSIEDERWDFYKRTENGSTGFKFRDCVCYSMFLPTSFTLEEAIEAAIKAGMPRGSFRGGIFEVQGPAGTWVSHRPGMAGPIVADKAIFTPW